MTNKEKAKLLSKKFGKFYTIHIDTLKDELKCSSDECEKVALDMADWKDTQFREYLEKKRDSMKLFPTEYDMCQEIINELFGDGKDN